MHAQIIDLTSQCRAAKLFDFGVAPVPTREQALAMRAALEAAYAHITAPSCIHRDGRDTVCTYRMGPGRYSEIAAMLRAALAGVPAR